MECPTDPSLVTRVAFLAATETPFLRRITTACSRSPLASVKACLQSIIGAPVFSRRSFTCAAEMFTVVVPISIKILRLLLFDASQQTLTRAGRPARVKCQTPGFCLSPTTNDQRLFLDRLTFD